jgi:GGDEF domain-containing protein
MDLLAEGWCSSPRLAFDQADPRVEWRVERRRRGGDRHRLGRARRRAATFTARRHRAAEGALAGQSAPQRALRRPALLPDPLTGLNNRRAAEEIFAREFSRARRSARPLSLVLADIDLFKRVNDRFGHHIGDQVLRAVSRCVAACCRATDVAIRWGGEELLTYYPTLPLRRPAPWPNASALPSSRSRSPTCRASLYLAAWPSSKPRRRRSTPPSNAPMSACTKQRPAVETPYVESRPEPPTNPRTSR